MTQFTSTLQSNKQDKLHHILLAYFRHNGVEILGKHSGQLRKDDIIYFISREGVLVNSVIVKDYSYQVLDGDRVEIQSLHVHFVCKTNGLLIASHPIQPKPRTTNLNTPLPLPGQKSKELDDQEKEASEEASNVILAYLNTTLRCKNIEDLKSIDTQIALSHIVELFQVTGFENLRRSALSYDLSEYVQAKITNSNIPKELAITKNQLHSAGILIDIVIQGKLEKSNNLRLLKDNLLNGQYDGTVFRFLRDYKNLASTDSFQYLIGGLLNTAVSNTLAIENLLKFVNDSMELVGIEPKYRHYEASRQKFDSYFNHLVSSNEYDELFFRPIAEYLFNLLKINCETAVDKSAHIVIEPTKRKYNFSNNERLKQEIFLIISNGGEGLAKNVKCSSMSKSFEFPPIEVGMLKPNERREISTIALVNHSSGFRPELVIQYQWEELSGKTDLSTCAVNFQIQKTDVPWEELKKQNPYSFSIIDSPDKLFGRNDILDELKWNILSDNIESYKLWGQKRVGKSSIVKTLKSILDDRETVVVIYRSLGGLRNAEATNTLNTLGKSLCSEIYEELDRKIADSGLRERLRAITVPAFDGSLFPLEDYIKKLRRIDSSLRFIFILDEFDRINEEFFLPGNLGETLSLSIGKGLNEAKHIGFILVGSENMHLLDRHGINYNSYRQKEVDTFHKQHEYASFIQIIQGPVSPYINYSDEAIDHIFYESNGNPYFANLICAEIFKLAYKLKDSEIDIHLVNMAVSLIVDSSNKSHFEHYWSDGITEEGSIMKERKADIRRRILVSFSMTSDSNTSYYPSRNEIARTFNRPKDYDIQTHEVENAIAEYFNRKIFVENTPSQVRILPPIFEKWLCRTGKTLMMEGVSDLEALQRAIDLERGLALKPDELARLSDNYHFKGEVIAPEALRSYFNQYGGATEQRKIFKLIDAIYYVPKSDILEFYKRESRNIFTKPEITLKEGVRKLVRENVELYTFSRHYSENLEIVESFKSMNHIRKQKLLKTIKDDSRVWKRNGADEIIIIEPVIDSLSDIKEELFQLLDEEIRNAPVLIRMITFLITTKAKADLIAATSSLSNMKLIVFREVEETKIKPFIQGTEIFENSEEANQTLFEVRKHFPDTRKDVLLVLFEDLCPSQSCQILWHQSPGFKALFPNLHGSIDGEEEPSEGEKRRDKLYFAAKELSQKINIFMINYLKDKAQKEGESDWFILKYIPRRTWDNVSKKWADEGQVDPKESYFDFIDYKEIIKNSKDDGLKRRFMIGDKDQLEWMNKCNELRRDPAHPEKPSPTTEEVEYFQDIMKKILPRLV